MCQTGTSVSKPRMTRVPFLVCLVGIASAHCSSRRRSEGAETPNFAKRPAPNAVAYQIEHFEYRLMRESSQSTVATHSFRVIGVAYTVTINLSLAL